MNHGRQPPSAYLTSLSPTVQSASIDLDYSPCPLRNGIEPAVRLRFQLCRDKLGCELCRARPTNPQPEVLVHEDIFCQKVRGHADSQPASPPDHRPARQAFGLYARRSRGIVRTARSRLWSRPSGCSERSWCGYDGCVCPRRCHDDGECGQDRRDGGKQR